MRDRMKLTLTGLAAVCGLLIVQVAAQEKSPKAGASLTATPAREDPSLAPVPDSFSAEEPARKLPAKSDPPKR